MTQNENLEHQLQQQQNEENEADEEQQKHQLEILNKSLLSTIAEYTKIRNEHAKRLEQQLCPIRCDIERRIRSSDLGFFWIFIF